MKQKTPGMVWLLISVGALLYPIAFWICTIYFFNKHPIYTPSRNIEFSESYPVFGNPLSATYLSVLFLIISIICSSVALNKIQDRKAYFIALPLVIISSLLFLLTLFSMM